jgi:glutamine---fructose-6-phosphate transaminase (isomerizing)
MTTGSSSPSAGQGRRAQRPARADWPAGAVRPRTTGIAHTRWATHGPPTEVNAHPHLDQSGEIALVHNGIIENYRSLRARLEGEGPPFLSETDTEVLAHLIGDCDKGDLFQAVCDALHQVEGTFGIAVLSAASRKKSSPPAAAARSSSAWAMAKPSSPPTPPPSSPTPSA